MRHSLTSLLFVAIYCITNCCLASCCLNFRAYATFLASEMVILLLTAPGQFSSGVRALFRQLVAFKPLSLDKVCLKEI